jgi:hypothetical protein
MAACAGRFSASALPRLPFTGAGGPLQKLPPDPADLPRDLHAHAYPDRPPAPTRVDPELLAAVVPHIPCRRTHRGMQSGPVAVLKRTPAMLHLSPGSAVRAAEAGWPARAPPVWQTLAAGHLNQALNRLPGATGPSQLAAPPAWWSSNPAIAAHPLMPRDVGPSE